eukprot:198677_1
MTENTTVTEMTELKENDLMAGMFYALKIKNNAKKRLELNDDDFIGKWLELDVDGQVICGEIIQIGQNNLNCSNLDDQRIRTKLELDFGGVSVRICKDASGEFVIEFNNQVSKKCKIKSVRSVAEYSDKESLYQDFVTNMKSNVYRQAELVADEIIKSNTSAAQGYLYKIQAILMQSTFVTDKQYEEAIDKISKLYKQGTEKCEDEKEEHAKMAKEHADFKKALTANKKAEKLVLVKQYDDAIKSYNLAIGLFPYHPVFHRNRCLAYILMKNYKDALRNVKYYIYLKPYCKVGYNLHEKK